MQFWDKGIMLVDGCNKVSPGCKNCWSEAMTARFKRVPEVLTDGHFNGIVKVNMHLLEKAAKVKKPHVYAIWNDLYHEGVTDEQIYTALRLMKQSPHHIFLIVTKRPERAADIINKQHPMGIQQIAEMTWAWHIVTCENQAMADKRIPELLKIPGKRGLIIEPMLEVIDLNLNKWVCSNCGDWTNGVTLNDRNHCQCDIYEEERYKNEIHQVILGPENGAGKRPFNPEWADSIKAQCESAGVPYYRKDKETGTLAWRVS